MAVQLEEHLHLAVISGLAHRLQPDFQRLAGVNLRGNLFARLHAIKEGTRWQGADRTIEPMAAHIVEEDLGIHQIAVQILIIDDKAAEIGRDFGAHCLMVHRCDIGTGTRGQRRFALQNLGLNALRPAAVGLAEISPQHVNHRVREGHVHRRIFDLSPCQPLGHHHQGHVTHNL